MRLFRRNKSETGVAIEQVPPESSLAAASCPIRSNGIKLFYSPTNPADAIVDIVFIHGLAGDRERTWTAAGAPEPWPKALLPFEVPTTRILTFGYDATVADWRGIVSQSRISNHAWNLLTSLASFRENDDTNERPIIFVCHSLGGLVCEDALSTSRQRTEPHLHSIFRLTRAIAFLGTPHHGAGLARWAGRLSQFLGIIKQTNTEIVAVLKQDSEVLARIQDEFHTMLLARSTEGQPIEISCFYEELPLPVVGQVVPQASAILPGYIPIGIHGNHMNMTRFATRDDPGYVAFCGEVRRWIKHLRDGPAGPQTSAATFLVLYTCNRHFVGRSDILEKLKSKLGDGHQSKWQQRVALYGLGGIGKTQIALAYVYWLQETQPTVSVFWIHASTVERFRESYASIAQECHVPGYEDPKTDMLALVKRWLERKERGPWVMVIDNADDTQVFIGPKGLGQHIPECTHGSILVTTRNKETGSRLTKSEQVIEVGKMDENESNQLLLEKLEEEHVDSHDLSTLSYRLEFLPLALVQAAAFMQENSVSVQQYLELLDKSDQNLVDLLSEEFETTGKDSGTPHTVTETWILSFNQIQRQNTFASELLSLMSLFDRHAIPQDFLSYYREQRQGPEPEGLQLTKALGVLKAFSFIAENKRQNFDIHRLVQLVTRQWLAKEGTARYFAGQALLAVSHCYPCGNYENQEVCAAYLPHADAVRELEGVRSTDEELARASLLHNVARFLHYQGQWTESEKFQAQSAELRRELLGLEHPDTLTSMSGLAWTYHNQGRWAEAEVMEVQVMDTRKRVLGSEHPDTLTSMANLAATYGYQSRWSEAEKLDTQVVETLQQKLGINHPGTMASMAQLASRLWNQGRWEEAEKLDIQVMEIYKTNLGADHPDTLASMASLAATYRKLGRYEEAAKLEVEVLETRKKKLGASHPYTLSSMANLASTYRYQGQLEEAEKLAVQAMELNKTKFGADNMHTLSTMNVLASIYREQGRWNAAEELQRKQLEICTRVQGQRDRYTLTSMSNLARIWKGMGRYEDALGLMETCFDLQQQILGEDHPSTLSTLSTLKAWREDNEQTLLG